MSEFKPIHNYGYRIDKQKLIEMKKSKKISFIESISNFSFSF